MWMRALAVALLCACSQGAPNAPDGGGIDAASDAAAEGAAIDAGPHVAFDECSSPKSEWLFCTGFGGNPAPTNVLVQDPGAWLQLQCAQPRLGALWRHTELPRPIGNPPSGLTS